MNLQEVPRLLADQARTRQTRRTIVLPMTTKMGVAAIVAELQIRAGDHEKILEALGLRVTSPLRRIADRLPEAADRSIDLLLRSGDVYASIVSQLADRVGAATG